MAYSYIPFEMIHLQPADIVGTGTQELLWILSRKLDSVLLASDKLGRPSPERWIAPIQNTLYGV